MLSYSNDPVMEHDPSDDGWTPRRNPVIQRPKMTEEEMACHMDLMELTLARTRAALSLPPRDNTEVYRDNEGPVLLCADPPQSPMRLASAPLPVVASGLEDDATLSPDDACARCHVAPAAVTTFLNDWWAVGVCTACSREIDAEKPANRRAVRQEAEDDGKRAYEESE